MLRSDKFLLMFLIFLIAFQCTPVYAAHNSGSVERVLLINSHDFTLDEITLLRLFGDLSTVVGPIAVLQTTTTTLVNEVQTLPFISRTIHPRHLDVQLDRSVPDVGAPLVWQEIKDTYGHNVTGNGVIVGLVDTGIDTTHPDFRFPNGTTKILYVWDQTNQGRPPSGFKYGFECSSIDIQSGTCPEIDTFGHGTHTTGIAASSGQATGNYTGVAPEASIIFVKSGHQTCNGSSWAFDDASILDGINYIIEKSRELGRRAVINLSLGGNIGGHDGTDPLELALDAFVRDGTPIVVAAGNDAESNVHVRGELKNNNTVTIKLDVKPNTTDIQIDSWFSTRDDIKAELLSPEGQTFTSGRNNFLTFGNVTATKTFTNHGQEAYFEISSSRNIPEVGWSIRLAAQQKIQTNGTWDSWIDAESCSFPSASFLSGNGYEIDHNDTIGIPGTAHNVVTVGAYITKITTTRSEQNNDHSTGFLYGEIASFSSIGPTRDGRIKPDIVAPGMFITSARSRLVPLGRSDPDQFHRVLAGTSMAAPHVSGIIALMLQYSPSLSAIQIATILRENAREDSFTGLLPSGGSRIWGSGKADARTTTGFYRLTLTSLGLPSSVAFQVNIDNIEAHLVGESWSDRYFLKGSIHRILINGRAITESDVRYSTPRTNFTLSRSYTEVLSFREQYYLNVRSSFGTAKGSGWYDANTTTIVEGPLHLNANGYVNLLGARFTQIGWLTQEGRIMLNGEVKVDHPMTLTAIYILTYQPWVVGVLLPVGSLLLIIVRSRKWSNSESNKLDNHSNSVERKAV